MNIIFILKQHFGKGEYGCMPQFQIGNGNIMKSSETIVLDQYYIFKS